jgi:serine O-acetyltransferase
VRAAQLHWPGLMSPAERKSGPPAVSGSTNQNPEDIGALALLREDLATYGYDPLQPGLWVVLLHRFGNWRMGVKPKLLRAPFTVAYKAVFRSLSLGVGIELAYNVKLGRRVRIWHHGGIFVNARSIGNDVHIRHNVAIGVASRLDPGALPTIEDGVDIYAGACIAGDVRVGHDSLVGANSVVTSDVPANTTAFGNPARRAPTTAMPTSGNGQPNVDGRRG